MIGYEARTLSGSYETEHLKNINENIEFKKGNTDIERLLKRCVGKSQTSDFLLFISVFFIIFTVLLHYIICIFSWLTRVAAF